MVLVNGELVGVDGSFSNFSPFEAVNDRAYSTMAPGRHTAAEEHAYRAQLASRDPKTCAFLECVWSEPGALDCCCRKRVCPGLAL